MTIQAQILSIDGNSITVNNTDVQQQNVGYFKTISKNLPIRVYFKRIYLDGNVTVVLLENGYEGWLSEGQNVFFTKKESEQKPCFCS